MKLIPRWSDQQEISEILSAFKLANFRSHRKISTNAATYLCRRYRIKNELSLGHLTLWVYRGNNQCDSIGRFLKGFGSKKRGLIWRFWSYLVKQHFLSKIYCVFFWTKLGDFLFQQLVVLLVTTLFNPYWRICTFSARICGYLFVRQFNLQRTNQEKTIKNHNIISFLGTYNQVKMFYTDLLLQV